MTTPQQTSAPDRTSQEPKQPETPIDQRWNKRVLWLLMALTFGTGIVDAIGYLALDHVFIGNMTGNVVILGMAIVGAENLPVLGPLAAMLCFSAGAAITGLILKRKPAMWSGTVTLLLLFAGLILISVGLLAFLSQDQPDSTTQLIMSSLAAAAMGAQAYVARKLAVREMTTVVVTSTLTALAGEAFFHRGMKGLLNRRIAAILAILLGAAMGAFLIKISIGLAMSASGTIIIAVALLGHWAAKNAIKRRRALANA
ncbi:YoaK family protein [Arthrobacter sp.]|uniref:YoaK family protein n=1 Tax=Arthrobacter sp. TaxID=1667 RepID=UPI002812594C|nr:YoaK family protein [Arthrobacter sp.]